MAASGHICQSIFGRTQLGRRGTSQTSVKNPISGLTEDAITRLLQSKVKGSW